jgi:hypothetical protein
VECRQHRCRSAHGVTIFKVRLIPGDNWFLLVAFFAWWAGFGMLFPMAQWFVLRNRWSMSRSRLALSSILGLPTPWVALVVGGCPCALLSRRRDRGIYGVITGSVMRFLPPPGQRSVAALSL